MNLTRQQLASVFRDPQMVRAFEDLFTRSEVQTPQDVAEVVTLAGQADGKATEALRRLDALVIPQVAVMQEDVINDLADTLIDADGLGFPVFANETYWFDATVIYSAAATTTGSRWSVNGPPFGLLSYSARYPSSATANTESNQSAYDLPAAANASSASIDGNIAHVSGIVRPTEEGFLTIRFASEVGGSAITAKAGSVIRYLRLT
jgi:hypothetical protein